MLQWTTLDSPQKLDQIIQSSWQKPVLVFKHSTRCSISSMALNRIERQWNFSAENVEPYFLDLIQYRNISNEIAKRFKVEHQSPQVLLIKDGECIFHTSHNDINALEIGEILEIKNA